ncbi:hypothetical protein SZN_16810 [Streptomyces zinciresistens K42]|uniref:Histidine kinase/HSP90-like ATPase domain-containing protein n=1 Tax=Streptomyces zinciresistens K42 TaxID=700597 RepID=G2GCY5_9ACTN|nr:ATP-binding protein [Streptomyces zinciresistens]EGX58648.1 hypothetical protein SZN_16810 [Streptomyces zinciresistens K42]
MSCALKPPRRSWELAFSAEPAEVASIRRVMRAHLELWGLSNLVADALLCVDELVSNVIDHVGVGTPASVTVSARGTRLRIEVRDPGAQALPVLVRAGEDCEAGRGMVLVAALTDLWGVQVDGAGKTTWCELVTPRSTSGGGVRD